MTIPDNVVEKSEIEMEEELWFRDVDYRKLRML